MERYIDADALKLMVQRCSIPTADEVGMVTVNEAERYFLKLIKEQPTADVVEIPCRCNECKSFVENKEALVTYCTRECKNLTVKPSDFCSYGERVTDTNERF